MKKIKEFLRDIFAPKIYYFGESQKINNEAVKQFNKVFKEMDKTFREMDKLFKKL